MVDRINAYIPGFLLSPQMKIYRHLLVQVVVFMITVNIFWDTPDDLILTPGRFIAWLGYYLMMNFIIYLNTYVLAPRFLLRNRLLVYLTSVSGMTVLSILIVGVLQSLFQDSRIGQITVFPVWLNVFSTMISVGLLVAGTSTLFLLRYWISDNQRISELESMTLRSELKLLKSQINPHFLFNMLNNANVLIRKDPEEASKVLFKLEDLLRYQINDSSGDKVLLSSDIHFLNDFLNLEKIRRDRFEYFISEEGNIGQVWLPPLLFIPFVENAVKHNNDSNYMSYICLFFKVQDHLLEFRCKNSKPAYKPDNTGVGGLGLRNIQRRLELLFPGHYSLNINDDENTYTVNLLLML